LHFDAYRLSEQAHVLKFQLLKFKMADAAILKKMKNCHVSATVRLIGTKFGLVAHIGPPNRTGS